MFHKNVVATGLSAAFAAGISFLPFNREIQGEVDTVFPSRAVFAGRDHSYAQGDRMTPKTKIYWSQNFDLQTDQGPYRISSAYKIDATLPELEYNSKVKVTVRDTALGHALSYWLAQDAGMGIGPDIEGYKVELLP